MTHPHTHPSPPVTVYWRPGCGFCSTLLRKLESIGVEHTRINIWDDDDAAAFVRTVANGNETVPTVTVGDRALVNPKHRQIINALKEVAPEHVPAGY